MNEKESLIYVPLDALFDTRLATLHRLDREKTIPLLRDSYFSRKYDEFEGYDDVAYKAMYSARDTETIQHAMTTDITRVILFFAEQTLKARASTPFVMQPKLHLNLYPYTLPDVAIKAIVEGLRIVTKGLIDIEPINIPISDLTPMKIKGTYSTLVMYEYWEWLEHHAKQGNFEKTFCPEITLIGPAIVPSREAWKEVKDVDIFPMIEQYSSMFIKLTLYPVTSFSINLEQMVKVKNG